MKSLIRIHALAVNTFREAIRNKLLYTLLHCRTSLCISISE